MKLSVIIPASKEPYLQKTIDSFLDASELGDEVEVIPVWDGTRYSFPLKTDSRVKVVSYHRRRGMRAAINAGLAAAKGEFVAKVDAHCVFDPGFDRIMVESIASSDWLMVPRRYGVDEDNWQSKKRYIGIDYHYLYHPCPKNGYTMMILPWIYRNTKTIDDTMIFQGSCWFANRSHFMKTVGLLDDNPETYGSFLGEQHEVGLKYWLSGGSVKVNKTISYGHLQKRSCHYHSGIFSKACKYISRSAKHLDWIVKHWTNDEEPGMKRPFAWLIEKFSPVPGWPEDRSLWKVKV